MHVLRLARHLPARLTAPFALPLDQARAGHVERLLEAHPDILALIRHALNRLDDGADAGASRIADRYTRLLLDELRRAPVDTRALRWAAQVDRVVCSDMAELMDLAATPRWVKQLEMALLDRVNRNMDSYTRWGHELGRILQGATSPVVYDLAAGSGGFARHLAQASPIGPVPTATDVDPGFVEQGRRLAARAGLPVRFEVRDALDLRDLRGRVDLFVCTQSSHHLSPGTLVRMLAQGIRSARLGIVVIDLVRSVGNVVAAYAATNATAPFPPMVLDGMQSVRRSYAPSEMRLLARIAGAAEVDTRVLAPAFTIAHARAG